MAKFVSEKVSNHILEDLALSVLSKLPLKSLKLFRCVNKTWSRLFENSHFMTMFWTNSLSIPNPYYNDISLLLHQVVYTPEIPQTNCYLYSLSAQRFENIVKFDLPNPFQEENPVFYILESETTTGTLCLLLTPCNCNLESNDI